MSFKVSIEHHPENGSVPFVVRLQDYDRDADIWFAYPDMETAETKQCEIASSWPLAKKPTPRAST